MKKSPARCGSTSAAFRDLEAFGPARHRARHRHPSASSTAASGWWSCSSSREYQPFNVNEEVLSIFAGTRGHLDDVPARDVAQVRDGAAEVLPRSAPGDRRRDTTARRTCRTTRGEGHAGDPRLQVAVQQDGRSPGAARSPPEADPTMATRRVLVKRRKAVRNIRKITRTMQLIATSPLPGGVQPGRGDPGRTPRRLAELVADLVARGPATSSTRCSRPTRGSDRSALVVLTQRPGPRRRLQLKRPAHGDRPPRPAAGGDDDRCATWSARRGSPTSRFLRRPVAEQTSGDRRPPPLRPGGADRNG